MRCKICDDDMEDTVLEDTCPVCSLEEARAIEWFDMNMERVMEILHGEESKHYETKLEVPE